MMQIMLNKMPDDPLAREYFRLVARIVFVALLHIRRGPACQRFLHDTPAGFQPGYQLCHLPFCRTLAVPLTQFGKLLVAHSHHVVKPAGAGSDDVADNGADRAQSWRSAQRKLIGSKESNRFCEERLVVMPTFVKDRERRCILSHALISFQ